ncbi:PLDc N-terminal domain-containing protein [Nocardioides terrisoli]|uniref:PLDc N-terminal domain-containing protein n=1 Tax=Nocardioides terrisoli TaxID=3388267 RepID=UPI00287BA950|nr:PLDc N-terminal domain-containing protein [Nocardioides marmorisolisilvae]
MSTAKKRWSDLSPTARKAIIAGGAAELVLTSMALRDLSRRDGSSVRGPKPIWVLSFVVQPFGPLAYLGFGRR